MEFSPEQLKKLKEGQMTSKKPFKKVDAKLSEKIKKDNLKKVSAKLINEELSVVLKHIEECKTSGADKAIISTLDYVGERKKNFVMVEGNLFYYYQYLFYEGYRMRPVFNGEGLMVILIDKKAKVKKEENGKAE